MIDLSDRAGFPVWLDENELTLTFGDGITTDPVTQRRVKDLHQMLPEPVTDGPDPVYSIYMNVQVPGISEGLHSVGLAFGAVVDAPGTIGREYVHSQGHVHSCPPGTDMAYLEIYEFWYGSGTVYLQDRDSVSISQATVIHVRAGDRVVIPPGWVHVVINTGASALAFGAIYAADATLMYDGLRALHGTAWRFISDGSYEPNPAYVNPPTPQQISPRWFPEYGIDASRPMMEVARHRPAIYSYVAEPHKHHSTVQAITHAASDG